MKQPRIYGLTVGSQHDPEAESRYFASLMDDIELSYLQGSSAGVRVTDKIAVQVISVFTCIRIVAETIGSLDLHYYRRISETARERVPNWLDTLLCVAPNGWQTRLDWIEQMWRHFELWGRCYSRMIPGPGGTITALVPLHPSRVRPVYLPTGKLRFIWTNDVGVEVPLEQDEVFHMHFMSDDATTGAAPKELHKETIGICRALDLHAARFFGNGARPGTVLETDLSLDPDHVERLRESWERIHRGPVNSHKTAVLDGGVKAKPFEGASNTDSQFIEAREYEIARVAAAYRVPPNMVGLLNRTSYGSVEASGIDFRNLCIAPRCRRMELALTRDLVADPENYFIRFTLGDLERADSQTRMTTSTAGVDRGIYSINEARAREGLNPIPGGDLHFTPLNMATLDAATRLPAIPPGNVTPVLDRLAAGGINTDAARVLLSVQNPTLSAEQVEVIVGGVTVAAIGQPTVSEPTEPITDAADAAAAGTLDLQSTALNGAQVAALLQVLSSVSAGQIGGDAAIVIIAAAFPTITPDQATKMVAGAKPGVTQTTPPLPSDGTQPVV